MSLYECNESPVVPGEIGSFFDGFVVLRGVVDKDSVRRARTLIDQDVKKIFHFDHPDINDLYNRSPISKILNDVMGPHEAHECTGYRDLS